MQVEIDQSVRVETTDRDTILALSNNIEYSICIPAAVKKQLLRTLREQKISDKIIYLKIFSAGLFILLEPYLEDLSSAIVDIEYEGKEADIKAILTRLFQKKYRKDPPFEIQFKRIGKKSFGHEVAYSVGRKHGRKPNKIVRLKEMLSLV